MTNASIPATPRASVLMPAERCLLSLPERTICRPALRMLYNGHRPAPTPNASGNFWNCDWGSATT